MRTSSTEPRPDVRISVRSAHLGRRGRARRLGVCRFPHQVRRCPSNGESGTAHRTGSTSACTSAVTGGATGSASASGGAHSVLGETCCSRRRASR
ncbi:hypothetical protein CZ774_08365 [Frigoribacterium sp. JB110]|nr:hypothetical protein CZ774_08365 [Frigoribacterium sp. JB110]